MNSKELIPQGDDAKDLLGLSGETVATLLKMIPGVPGAAVDLAKALVKFSWKRWQRRVEEFARDVQVRPLVVQSLESAKEGEPLLDVFMSMFDACLRDDEDEKTEYYAKFTIGIAERGRRVPKATRLRLMDAIRSLRTYDLEVLTVVGMLTRVNTQDRASLPELEAHMVSRRPDPVGWQLLPEGLAALASKGLLDDKLVPQIFQITRETKLYRLTDAGNTLWSLLSDEASIGGDLSGKVPDGY